MKRSIRKRWGEPGACKIEIGLPDDAPKADITVEMYSASTDLPHPSELVVARVGMLNPRVLLARSEGSDKVDRVLVKDSNLFMVGQKIPVRFVSDGLFELAGLPPRKRGAPVVRSS